MDSYKVVLSPTARWTRLLVSHGPDELLRAILPPPAQVGHRCAASTLLQGLSLWLNTRLAVVLSVGAGETAFCLGLTDRFGAAEQSTYYHVEVTERGRRQRRGTRIQGVGDFTDLRQLCLVPDDRR